MPLKIIHGDITKLKVDAIVNSDNSTLLFGGGVDGAIRKAAGKGLFWECLWLFGCREGHAKITKGYKLPCKHIIHTVGPQWQGGNNGEEETLKACYRACMGLAFKNNCSSVAFPLISAGSYKYPESQALRVAEETIEEALKQHDITAYIVLYDKP